ncbi:hypothetical protein HZC30_03925 [Candidatus Woesearchaeota archaeon]|nr:hypothetical protein [Candidatus Woesearchaeota archaeon]
MDNSKLKSKGWILTLFGLFGLVLVPLVLAEDNNQNTIVVINSERWEDIYSGIIYANFNQLPFDYLVMEQQAVYHSQTFQNYQKAILIESSDNPVVAGYRFDIEDAGPKVEKLALTTDINLDLAKLTSASSFILVDSTYPSNALSVVPYATLTRSYVLFVSKENIGAVVSLLKEKKAEKLLLYGFIDPEAKAQLAEFSPEEINLGDKFSNNIEIVKTYLQLKPMQQVTFTSGDFMEAQFMKGVQPILFIGEKDIPDALIDFLKGSEISVAEVVGNELTPSATKVKRTLESEGKPFYVFIRFGQGKTLQGAESIKKISSLDLFYLPQAQANLTISNINYNRATKQLEVTYVNPSAIGIYAKSTLKVLLNGTKIKSVGDEEPFFILAGEEKILGYDLDLSSYEPLEEKELKAEIFTQYGEGAKSLSLVLEASRIITFTSVTDDSSLEAVKLTYSADLYKKLIPGSSAERTVKLKVKNTGNVKVYYRPTLILNQKGTDHAYTQEETYVLDESKKDTLSFVVDLEGVSVKDKAKVDILYGSRENILAKRLKQEMELTPTYWTDIIILAVLLLGGMLWFIAYRYIHREEY